ncbi:glutamine-hydrolyzing carbamoyl-phosphate synthase small subunit [Methanobrevibacter filiformis]|uniref:Carbamoyl phosphate synthase small chain n=1 Tax=Methanobrevibacter filiformis TaxID=55758 RepID=A0A165Z5J6_9EURY|nr:glutamine-hydrolyzing carbamoyl-phosphate synthase small subunit [Methanobrevibacter filiformis]KZX10276.1 carbamoyl-phosphate synthase small chain [Methanobrevibacter filiformis]
MEIGAKLALEDGTIIKGEGFGHETTKLGEIVFSTGMAGYVESLTDPSFKGQVLMSTYPLQGNYGVSESWYQSNKIQVEGYIVRELCREPSMFSSQKTLDEFLNDFKVPGISGVDTRDLTIKIRENGSMNCAISTEDVDDDELIALAKNHPCIEDIDLVPMVSTKKPVVFAEELNKKVAIIDCGVKRNIINGFLKRDIGVVLFPYNSTAKDVLDYDVGGLMVSCGPGNPARLLDTVETIKGLHEKLPIFGICMGQQIVSKSFGVKTYKMKFGHRGANQPVKDLKSGKVFITSQNHGFSVDTESLVERDLELTQINLNDNTPEGFSHKELPIHCVQYHPEAGPGPNDTNYIFDKFNSMIEEY